MKNNEHFIKSYKGYNCPKINYNSCEKKVTVNFGPIITKVVNDFEERKDKAIAKELFKLYEGNVEVVLIDKTEFMHFVKVMLPKYLEMKEGK